MAILPTDGRIALAKHLADAPMHFAWGTGESWWNAQQRSQITLDAAGRADLPYPPEPAEAVKQPDGSVIQVEKQKIVTNILGGEPYQPGRDYTISGMGAVIRTPTGDMPTDATLIVEYTAGRRSMTGGEHSLISEVGRRPANTVVFVLPDEAGDLETPGGQRWRVSSEPTRHLYLGAHFSFSDASSDTIREVAVFTDTLTIEGVPLGQLYLAPNDIASTGCLLLLDRLKPIFRSPAETRSFAYVVTL